MNYKRLLIGFLGTLVVLLAVPIVGIARAQVPNLENPFRVSLQCTGTERVPMPVIRAPMSMPKGITGSLSTCTAPIIGMPSTGLVLGWACVLNGTPRVYLTAVRNSAVTPEMVLSAAAIPTATDPKEAFRAHQARFVTDSFWNMCDVWGHSSTDWRDRFIAATDPLFLPEAWSVAKNSTYTTRPAYLVTEAGGLQAQNGRVAVGAPCDCALRRIVFGASTVYCRVDGVVGGAVAEHVAVCTKTTP